MPFYHKCWRHKLEGFPICSLIVFMKNISFLLTQEILQGYEFNGIPNPYQFSYSAPSEGGASSHQESGDGSGRVTGSYSVVDEDGRSRVVEYIADEGGFRASITTNEPGTSNQAPADVTISSSAEEAYSGGKLQFLLGNFLPRDTFRV